MFLLIKDNISSQGEEARILFSWSRARPVNPGERCRAPVDQSLNVWIPYLVSALPITYIFDAGPACKLKTENPEMETEPA